MLISNSGRNPVSYGQPSDLVRALLHIVLYASSRSSKRAITDKIFRGIAFLLVFRNHVRYVACLRA